MKFDTKSRDNKKKKMDELDFIKTKTFCASKDAIDIVKWQLMEWDEIFTNHVFYMRLIAKI